MYYSIINCGKKIESKELLYYFCMLPIEYLNFEKDCNNIIFNFHNPIFLKAIKNTIRNLVKKQSFNFLLKEVNEKALFNAIFEEKLLTLLISYNKFKLKNWELYEKNLLELEKIVNFKNKNIKKTENIIKKGFPIVVTQKDFTGEHYDLLILFPFKVDNHNFYIAYMAQIGLNKIKSQIETIRKDFKNNANNYILRNSKICW